MPHDPRYKDIWTAPDGMERVYSLTTKEESPALGIAIADITRSVTHWHKVTTEMYILLSGCLRITVSRHGVVHLVVLDKPFDQLVIEPHTVHGAESLDASPARIIVLSTPHWSPEDHFTYK